MKKFNPNDFCIDKLFAYVDKHDIGPKKKSKKKDKDPKPHKISGPIKIDIVL